MFKKMYVGNLSYVTPESEVRKAFEQFGSVESVRVIVDRETGRSKGFGFVEMSSDQEAQSAIEALDKKEYEGRTLTVNEARPMEARPPRRDFNGGNQGGYSGRNNY